MIANRASAHLTDEESVRKETMGPKAIRALQRLAVVPAFDLQSAFLGDRTS